MNRIPLAVAIAVTALATVLMWGPVSRGLHEESVARWCTWSASAGAASSGQIDSAVAECVRRSLSDPDYLAALRASL